MIVQNSAEYSMSLREAIYGYLMDGKIADQSKRYIVLKEQRLGLFADWCEKQGVIHLDSVTANIIRGFIVYLQGIKAQELNPNRPTQSKPLSPLTVRGYRMIVDAFFVWCKKEGYLGNREIPTKSIPRQKIPEFVIETFSQEQLKDMLEACDLDSPLGYRDYALILVLVDTGVRASEICGLKLNDVHERYIKVFGKGRKEREVGLGSTSERAIWRYIHQFRSALVGHENEEHVFLGRNGKPLLRGGLYQLLQRIGEAADIQGVRLSPHTFRHTFAVNYLNNGGEIFKLSRILGHTEMETTQIYLKDFQSREARASHSQFSPVEKFRLGKTKGKKRK